MVAVCTNMIEQQCKKVVAAIEVGIAFKLVEYILDPGPVHVLIAKWAAAGLAGRVGLVGGGIEPHIKTDAFEGLIHFARIEGHAGRFGQVNEHYVFQFKLHVVFAHEADVGEEKLDVGELYFLPVGEGVHFIVKQVFITETPFYIEGESAFLFLATAGKEQECCQA